MHELRTDDQAPWKQRYHAPITWTQPARIAPMRGLAVSNRSGVFQLYAWDVATGALTQLTDRPTGVIRGQISPDGRYVHYLDDQAGNEIGHFVRVPFAGGPPEDLTPDMPPYSPAGGSISGSSNRTGFMAADECGFHAYTQNMAPDGAFGTPRLFYETTSLAFGPHLSYNGDVAIVSSTERTGKPQFSLLAFDIAIGERIGELWDEGDSSIDFALFSPLPGDTRCLATTNRSGVTRPLVWDARNGERCDLPLDELAGDVEVRDWSADGARILLCQVAQAVQQLYLYNLQNNELTRLKHPSGSLGGAYFMPDGEIFVQWEDAAHPLQLIALDEASGAQRRVVLSSSDVPPGHAWRSVSFTSSDGQQIQAWLGLPDGAGPFPTILDTHGGPAGVTTESFSPGAQSWLDHGFAWLSINYRGSVTFGKAFEQQIWGDVGHWEIEDMTAARDWLVSEGIAQPDAILLTGWSYGGYLTLLGLGKRPDLWAGGMAGIAIADWTVQYEDTADLLRGYQTALFEGTPTEKPEAYAASSPITYVEQVAAPVLVIQGSNDTRCPARPMRMYEERMRALGKEIEVHWFEAGHGSYVVSQAIEHQERMLRFAYRVLG